MEIHQQMEDPLLLSQLVELSRVKDNHGADGQHRGDHRMGKHPHDAGAQQPDESGGRSSPLPL